MDIENKEDMQKQAIDWNEQASNHWNQCSVDELNEDDTNAVDLTSIVFFASIIHLTTIICCSFFSLLCITLIITILSNYYYLYFFFLFVTLLILLFFLCILLSFLNQCCLTLSNNLD